MNADTSWNGCHASSANFHGMHAVLARLFPSMFLRRLLLLAGAAVASLGVLGAQLGHLTLSRGAELRRSAEERLIRRQWTPTVRGSILDRKGRVLAQDRPSYDLAVDYRVITGDWAWDRALVAARRRAGGAWFDMTGDQRAAEIAALLPTYRVHMERAWDELARLAGMERAALDKAAADVRREVEGRHEYTVRMRREREYAALAERGEARTPEIEKSIERRVTQEIAEQRASHVLVRRVSDDVGFAARFLADEEVDLDLAGASGSEAAWTDRVPRMPGMRVNDAGDRDYPMESLLVGVDKSTLPGPLRGQGIAEVRVDGLAAHVLGTMRDQLFGTTTDSSTGRVTLGDADARRKFLSNNPNLASGAMGADGADLGAYREGDRVGATGIEASREHALRGLRGVQTRHLDTNERDYVSSVPGRDVSLSIDIMLQARVQAAMTPELGLSVIQPWHATQRIDEHGNPIPGVRPDGSPLYGAAVVLDIDSGEILAMVSTPTFTRRQLRENPETIFGSSPEVMVTTPWINRAVQKAYQPGSIVKSLLLAEAVTHGNYRPEQRIECTGHLFPGRPTTHRCWIYKRSHTTHNAQLGHDLDGAEALMVSCNIFFFTIGRRMGPEGIAEAFKDFGVGTAFGLGLAGEGRDTDMEFPGRLGSMGNDPLGADLTIGDAIQMGIGQGPVLWTPLHAANAYATLARHGVWVQPRLSLDAPRHEPRNLGLDERGVQMAMEGLRLSVNSNTGTGHHITIDARNEPIFNAPGVNVWGKTGTAAAEPIRGDPDGAEGPLARQILEAGDHSWFVVMVGRDRPRYVISVVIDFGGSGGKVSGPITNQIIHALIHEGYL